MDPDTLSRCVQVLTRLLNKYREEFGGKGKSKINKNKSYRELYHELVEHQLWLHEIEEKFKKGDYTSVDALAMDLRRVAGNSLRYNTTEVGRVFRKKATNLLKEVDTEFQALGGTSMPPHVMICLQVFEKLLDHKSDKYPAGEQHIYYPFGTRIELAVQSLPEYTVKIKELMDFGKLISLLVEQFISVSEFWKKGSLVFSNCLKYWGPLGETSLTEKAKELDEVFQREMSQSFPKEKKKGQGGGGGGAPRSLARQGSIIKIKGLSTGGNAEGGQQAPASPTSLVSKEEDDEGPPPTIQRGPSFVFKPVSKEVSSGAPGKVVASRPALPKLKDSSSFSGIKLTREPSAAKIVLKSEGGGGKVEEAGENDNGEGAVKRPSLTLKISNTGSFSIPAGEASAGGEADGGGAVKKPPIGTFEKRKPHEGLSGAQAKKSEGGKAASFVLKPSTQGGGGEGDRPTAKRKAGEGGTEAGGGGKKAKTAEEGGHAKFKLGPKLGSFSKAAGGEKKAPVETEAAEVEAPEVWEGLVSAPLSESPVAPAPKAAPRLKKKDSKAKKDKKSGSMVQEHLEEWVKAARVVLDRVNKHPFIKVTPIQGQNTNDYKFVKPVLELFPDIKDGYLKVVSRPMDLSTLAKNLHDGVYATAREFIADLRLIFQNAVKFNSLSQEEAYSREICAVSTYMEQEYVEMLAMELLPLEEEPSDSHYSLSEQRRDVMREKRFEEVKDLVVDKTSSLKEPTRRSKMLVKNLKNKTTVITTYFRDPVDREQNAYYYDFMKDRRIICFQDIDQKIDGVTGYTVGNLYEDVKTIYENAVFFNGGKIDETSLQIMGAAKDLEAALAAAWPDFTLQLQDHIRVVDTMEGFLPPGIKLRGAKEDTSANKSVGMVSQGSNKATVATKRALRLKASDGPPPVDELLASQAGSLVLEPPSHLDHPEPEGQRKKEKDREVERQQKLIEGVTNAVWKRVEEMQEEAKFGLENAGSLKVKLQLQRNSSRVMSVDPHGKIEPIPLAFKEPPRKRKGLTLFQTLFADAQEKRSEDDFVKNRKEWFLKNLAQAPPDKERPPEDDSNMEEDGEEEEEKKEGEGKEEEDDEGTGEARKQRRDVEMKADAEGDEDGMVVVVDDVEESAPMVVEEDEEEEKEEGMAGGPKVQTVVRICEPASLAQQKTWRDIDFSVVPPATLVYVAIWMKVCGGEEGGKKVAPEVLVNGEKMKVKKRRRSRASTLLPQPHGEESSVEVAATGLEVTLSTVYSSEAVAAYLSSLKVRTMCLEQAVQDGDLLQRHPSPHVLQEMYDILRSLPVETLEGVQDGMCFTPTPKIEKRGPPLELYQVVHVVGVAKSLKIQVNGITIQHPALRGDPVEM